MTETWNGDATTITNQIANDIPDIKENLTYLSNRFGYIVDPTEVDQGSAGNGRSIKDFVDVVGSTKKATLFLPHYADDGNTTTYTVSTSETIPSNINIIVQPGAILSIASGVTLTINGGFEVGLYQIFSYTGTGVVVFGSGVIENIYPEWWYSSGSWSAAFSAAGVCASASGVPIQLMSKTYEIGTSVVFEQPITMYGSGRFKTVIECDKDLTGWMFTFCSDGTNNMGQGPTIKNLKIEIEDDSTTPGGLLRLTDVGYGLIDNLRIEASSGTEGIRLENNLAYSEHNVLSNIRVSDAPYCIRFVDNDEAGVSDRYVTPSGGSDSFNGTVIDHVTFNLTGSGDKGIRITGNLWKSSFRDIGCWNHAQNTALIQFPEDYALPFNINGAWTEAIGGPTAPYGFLSIEGDYLKNISVRGLHKTGYFDIAGGSNAFYHHSPRFFGYCQKTIGSTANYEISNGGHFEPSERYAKFVDDFYSLKTTETWTLTNTAALATTRPHCVILSPDSNAAVIVGKGVARSDYISAHGYYSFQARFRVTDLTTMNFYVGSRHDHPTGTYQLDNIEKCMLFTNEDGSGAATTTLSFVITGGGARPYNENSRTSLGTIAVDTWYTVHFLSSEQNDTVVIFLNNTYVATVTGAIGYEEQYLTAGAYHASGTEDLIVDCIISSTTRDSEF